MARRTKITDFTRLHQQAGLSFNETIQLIEVSRTTGYRYQAGTSEPSGAARKLLEEAASHRAANTPGWFTFIDLFAGIGGLRKGFESIGGRCVFTSEWDLNSQKTYANIVDNSIAAEATVVELRLEMDYKGSVRVAIADNGIGMNQTGLLNAMKYGSDRRPNPASLGKFGLGLKTASTAFCRRLSLISRHTGNASERRSCPSMGPVL